MWLRDCHDHAQPRLAVRDVRRVALGGDPVGKVRRGNRRHLHRRGRVAHVDYAQRLGWQVCESNINAGPQWHDPGTTPPPLAVQDAITISYSELSDYFPEVELWDLQDIWLNSFGPGKWFYVVSWKARGTVVENDLEIPVLMDGRAVKLVTE